MYGKNGVCWDVSDEGKLYIIKFIIHRSILTTIIYWSVYSMNEVTDELIEYLRTKSFLDEAVLLTTSDSLTERGIIDSIGLIEFVDFIQDRYAIEIPGEYLTPENFDTIQGITDLIMKLSK
jgi:acyl carrier protein